MIPGKQLGIITLLAVYIGIAGIWGALLGRHNRKSLWLAAGFGFLLIFPASISLPWGWAGKIVAWVMGLASTWVYMSRPAGLPGWLWNRRFSLGYHGVIMVLILIWTLIAGNPMLLGWMGLPALIAGMLVLLRIIQGNGGEGLMAKHGRS